MPLIHYLLSFPFAARREEIEFFRRHPLEAQEREFFMLLQKASETEWGRKYNYEKISQSLDFNKAFLEFQDQVPISNYDDLKIWIEKIRQGKKDVLWPGEVKWFAKSSGTTSDKSKFIPVTSEALDYCHYRGGKDIMALYSEDRFETNIFTGKTLSIGGSYRSDENNDNIFCGDLSAILMDNLPVWVKFLRVPELPIALMSEWGEKIDSIAHSTIDKNVVALAGVPSWTLVVLRRVLEISGKKNLLEVWPNLELFIHGGISFEPYREQYRELIPSDKMNYLEVYNASEGFLAINDHSDRDDMLLMLDYGIFYEFLPMSELSKLDDLKNNKIRTLSVAEVEVGKNYALLISTNGGLWRYLIGDTVEITSKRPLRVKVSGRTKHFINVFGEELMVGNTEAALKLVCAQNNCSVLEYTVAPVFMETGKKGAHEWLVEFSKEPNDIKKFTHDLDEALKNINSDYEAKRYLDMALTLPIINVARVNLFHDWLKSKNKLGGQNKVPRLSNYRTYLEELLALS